MFNIESFDIKLDTEVIGRNFIYCEKIKSTNSELLNSKEFSKDGVVLLAEEQTSGRGRRERDWVSNPEQNLTFSILLKRNFTTNQINRINLGTSLVLAQSIENLYQLKVNLKWPNDVLLSDRKVAGILLESVSRGNKVDRIVVGVGVNVNQVNFEGSFMFPPTSIRRELKREIQRERLMSEFLNNFETMLDSVEEKDEKIIQDWRDRCRMIGERVKIVEGDKEKYGVFHDIDENGYLILKKNEIYEKIHFGDVSLRQ